MRRLRTLLVIPVLLAAVAGMGRTQGASAATCSLSLSPGYTAAYVSSLYGGFTIGGGPGVAAFYTDPFGVLAQAGFPQTATAAYFNSFGGFDMYGNAGVAIICTP